MLQTSILLMKSLNKTETSIFFLSVVCSLFPKAIFLTFISLKVEEPDTLRNQAETIQYMDNIVQ